MDIIQTFLLCIFGTCFLWFIIRALQYNNEYENWKYPYNNYERTMKKPTFWDK